MPLGLRLQDLECLRRAPASDHVRTWPTVPDRLSSPLSSRSKNRVESGPGGTALLRRIAASNLVLALVAPIAEDPDVAGGAPPRADADSAGETFDPEALLGLSGREVWPHLAALLVAALFLEALLAHRFSYEKRR